MAEEGMKTLTEEEIVTVSGEEEASLLVADTGDDMDDSDSSDSDSDADTDDPS